VREHVRLHAPEQLGAHVDGCSGGKSASTRSAAACAAESCAICEAVMAGRSAASCVELNACSCTVVSPPAASASAGARRLFPAYAPLARARMRTHACPASHARTRLRAAAYGYIGTGRATSSSARSRPNLAS
jgi:hypothetical protein